jgi:ribonuclease-3
MDKLKNLEISISYKFKDRELLEEALTHKSSKKAFSNERLEFLGDAVLDLIIGEYLYHKFTELNEGDLSKLRASLVSEKGFEALAKKLDLGSYLYISMAEENNNGRYKPSLLANAFEALIGCIYLESGLDIARDIVLKILNKVHPKIDLNSLSKDYKTTLQELTQAKFGSIPTYSIVKTVGPDHNKVFTVEVCIDNKTIDQAEGKSKKEAQQKVAKKALEKLSE